MQNFQSEFFLLERTMFNLLVLHSISSLQDSSVQTKGDDTEGVSVGQIEEL